MSKHITFRHSETSESETRHSPLKQEPRGEAVHRDREEALGLRAVDVHRDDLLHPRHLQHPGNQLGRDRLPLVRLLVVASVNVECLSLEIELQNLLLYLAYGINGSTAVIRRAPASLHALKQKISNAIVIFRGKHIHIVFQDTSVFFSLER